MTPNQLSHAFDQILPKFGANNLKQYNALFTHDQRCHRSTQINLLDFEHADQHSQYPTPNPRSHSQVKSRLIQIPGESNPVDLIFAITPASPESPVNPGQPRIQKCK